MILKLTLCLLVTSLVCIFFLIVYPACEKHSNPSFWLRDFESSCFSGLANIWLSVEYFRMLLLAFVEPLPLLINKQEFGGVQVRARLPFRVAVRVGETRYFSYAARAVSTFSCFWVIWEWNLESCDPSAQGIGFWNASMLFDLWIIRSTLRHLK